MIRRFPSGLILLDKVDIICLGISTGSAIAGLIKFYRRRKKTNNEDSLASELRENSPVLMKTTNGQPLKTSLVRGGEDPYLKGYSLAIKNKRLFQIVGAIINATKKQRQLKMLSDLFFILNCLLTRGTGLRIAVGGSLDYTQIILFAFPLTIGGFFIGMLTAYPILGFLIPYAIVAGRFKNVVEPSDVCRELCQVAAEFHNRQLKVEIKHLNSLLEEAAGELNLPIDKVPLFCEEFPLSLLERHRMNSLIKDERTQKRIQHFSEFIKKFPECENDPETAYNEVLKLGERIKIMD